MTDRRSAYVALYALLAAAGCSGGEQGVVLKQGGDPVVVLSEHECRGTCPVYDITLHPDGAYLLNGTKFVKTEGVSEGTLGADAWTEAVDALENAGFWSLKPTQTAETLPNCVTDAPDAVITWRDEEGREKTVVYNAGCGVPKMQKLVQALRGAMNFDGLVWTDERFNPATGVR